MKKVSTAGLAIALMASTSVFAQTVKYDTTIAKAAAQKAAEKVGEINGTISFDQVPEIVTKEDLAEKPVNTSFLPNSAEATEEKLPPMTLKDLGIDLTTTGSIKPAKKQVVIWEKFDRYGNPIK